MITIKTPLTKGTKGGLRATNTKPGEEFLLKSTMTTITATSFSRQRTYKSSTKTGGDDLLEQHGSPIPASGNGDDSVSANRKRSDRHSHDHSDLTFSF